MTLAGELLLLIVVGAVAGTVNMMAAGGSFLTLPVLLFLGVPPTVANATNRVGVFAQNIGGVWGFHRHGVLEWRWALLSSLPAIAGAGLGAWLALRVPNLAFTRILSIAMLTITFFSLWWNRRGGATAGPGRPIASPGGAWLTLGFFVVGIYGGFLQAGVGFFILALTSVAGLDLVRGNAAKVWSILMMSLVALTLFAQSGTVDWTRGLALAAGNFTGSFAGVRLAVLKGHHWLERVVTATVVLFALLLWAS